MMAEHVSKVEFSSESHKYSYCLHRESKSVGTEKHAISLLIAEANSHRGTEENTEAIVNIISKSLLTIENILGIEHKFPLVVCLHKRSIIPHYYKDSDSNSVIVLSKRDFVSNPDWNNQNILHELVHCVVYNDFSKALSEGLAVYVSHSLTNKPTFPTRQYDLLSALSRLRDGRICWTQLLENHKSRDLFVLSKANYRTLQTLYIQAGALVQRLVRDHGVSRVASFVANLHENLKIETFVKHFELGEEIDAFVAS